MKSRFHSFFPLLSACACACVCLGLGGIAAPSSAQDVAAPSEEIADTPDLKGNERVWGLILYAHSDSKQAADSEAKMERFHPGALNDLLKRIGKALPQYKHFNIVGAHDQKVLKEYATWITPSPEFFLEIDSKGRAKEGDGINIYLQLWSKQFEPGKPDKVLVKSDAVLKRGSPLIIEGPKWRKGRVVFVLVLEYTELLKKA